METLEVRNWDAARDMDSKESVMAYLETAFDETDFSNPCDLKLFLAVLGDIARSNGMIKIAQGFNLSRESLCQPLLKDDNPSFASVMNVFNSLGLRLTLRKSA